MASDEPSPNIINLSSDDDEEVDENVSLKDNQINGHEIHEGNNQDWRQANSNSNTTHINQPPKRQRLDSLYLNNGPFRPSSKQGSDLSHIGNTNHIQQRQLYPKTLPNPVKELERIVFRPRSALSNTIIQNQPRQSEPQSIPKNNLIQNQYMQADPQSIPNNNTIQNQYRQADPQEDVIILSSEDEDMDSDGDIMILDAEEASRIGKFKTSSFERNANRSSREIGNYEAPANTLTNGPNGPYYSVPAVNPNEMHVTYNNPAPVPHFTKNDGPEVEKLNFQRAQETLEENVRRKDELLHKHEQLTSDFTKSLRQANELLQHLTLLQSHLKREEFEENRDENTILSLKNEISFKGAEYHNFRRSKDATATSLSGIASKLSWLTVSIRDAKSRIHNYGKHRNGVNIIDNPFVLNNNSGRNNSDYENESIMNNPFGNIPGFSANVYSDNDQQHLQNLLNNIRPDEELDEEGLSLTPSELAITLLKHQRMGLAWLLRMEESKSKGGILADDMGLGKTVQTIALIMAHKSDDDNRKTNLVIAPVSLLRQWAAEIESKIKPNAQIKIAIYHGSEKKSLRTFNSLKKYDVVLTSYGTLSSEWKKHYQGPLEEARLSRNQNVIPDLEAGGTSYTSPFFATDAVFYRIILDEAQNIKNKSAIASKALYCIKGIHRFCLSGTPIQNNVEELYPILRFLRIKPYNDESKFRTDIVLPIRSKSSGYDDFDKKKSMQKLRALLRAILLRRSKNSLIDGKPILSLPDKLVTEDTVQMEDEELTYYRELEQGIQKKAKTLLASEKLGSTSSILTLLLRLRQACCHSFLVEMGRMKAAESEADKTLITRDWKSMYVNIQKFDEDTINRIRNEVHQGNLLKSENEGESNTNSDEDLFTCPICYDVLGYESIVLFSGCGHMICNNCIENFFERFETGDGSEGNRLASCFSCSKSIKENELIDYNMFHMIHQEGYDRDKIAEFYNINYSSNGKTTNMQKIRQLIQENKGFTPSAKMEKCMHLIKDVLENYPDEKIIIFSQFLSLFDLMKLVLANEKIPFLRYDGSMSLDEKNSTIKQFYQGSTKVLLISLRAGNVGLTLTCASHVIIMDPFWNPYVEEQAMDRAHRIGQQRDVRVHRILTEGSVEGRIMTLQNEKKEIISGALDEKGMKSVSKLGRQELGFLFGLNELR